MDDIQTLIEGCTRNDRKAQELLYKKFHDAMAALCMRYTKNKQDAAEAMNDGFLKVFKNINQYDAAKGSIATWIRSIMIHAAIDFLRRQQIAYTSITQYSKDEPEVENEVLQKIDADILLALIRKLPTATQLVFNLYMIDGFSHKEIASMMNISEGTSRWHLSDGKRQLKQSLQIFQEKHA